MRVEYFSKQFCQRCRLQGRLCVRVCVCYVACVCVCLRRKVWSLSMKFTVSTWDIEAVTFEKSSLVSSLSLSLSLSPSLLCEHFEPLQLRLKRFKHEELYSSKMQWKSSFTTSGRNFAWAKCCKSLRKAMDRSGPHTRARERVCVSGGSCFQAESCVCVCVAAVCVLIL